MPSNSGSDPRYFTAMHFTLWPGLTAREGGHAEIAWESFLAFVSSPKVSADRNTLEGWSPARFKGNTRSKANVEAVSCVVLDDDKSGLQTGALIAIWQWAAGVIHTSHSNTAESPRYRIVLRLSRDVTADEYSLVWRAVRDLAVAKGQTVDEATKDPSRFWFVPAHREGAPYACYRLDGAPLDVDAILAAPPAAQEHHGSDQPGTPSRGGEHIGQVIPQVSDRRRAFALALGSAWPAKGRHEAQLALAGALRAEGFSEAGAVEFLCAVCKAAGDEDRPKREATIRHTYNKPADAPLTGWSRLKRHVDPVVVDAARGALGRDAEWTERTERRLAEVTAAPLAPPVVTGDAVTVGPFVFKVGGLDAPQPPLVWLVDGLICKADVCMLVAHGNSLKTWLAFSLALAVAAGRPWLGRFTATIGRVGILDFESGEFEMLRRLKLLGARDEAVADRLLRCSYSSADLDDPETWIALAALKLDLLVIDSFNAAASADSDENDASAANMLKNAGRFADATGCTVIVIHHSRKGSGGDRREAVRGSTALYAACDRIFEFNEPEKKDGGIVLTTMHSIKDGAGRTPVDVRVELSDQGLRYIDAPAQPAPDAYDRRAHALRIIQEHTAGVHKSDLMNMLEGAITDRRATVSALVLEGLVVEYKAEQKVFVMLRPGAEI